MRSGAGRARSGDGRSGAGRARTVAADTDPGRPERQALGAFQGRGAAGPRSS